jgi:hypothetical protein
MQTFDPVIGNREKRQWYRRKLTKIAGNCDHCVNPGRVCVKVVRIVAQPIFCQNLYVTVFRDYLNRSTDDKSTDDISTDDILTPDISTDDILTC